MLKKCERTCWLRLTLWTTALLTIVMLVASHADEPSVPAENSSDEASGEELIQIDWVEKSRQGGFTMVALGLLSVTALAIAFERWWFVRRVYVAPVGLAEEALKLIRQQDFVAVQNLCRQHPSTLGRVLEFIVDHRDNPVDTITTAANDIAGREIRGMLARTSSLAVIASLAPLLGLLGTMIGMIEAFELVSVYGDEGGAAMLAGSIAKALITTAAGLIIAIPAVAAHQFLKQRINNLTQLLELDTEQIMCALFLKRSPVGNAVPASTADKPGPAPVVNSAILVR